MEKKKIKYVGFYEIENYEIENRNYTLSAKNKMDYIINSLEELEYEVEIISPAWSRNDEGVFKERNIKVLNKSKLIMPKTFGTKNRLKRVLRILNSWIWIISYILKNTNKGENIIVYHSLMLMFPLFIVKKIKKINLIIEVEEIYSDVIKCNNIIRNFEMYFINIGDRYILSNDLLNDKIKDKKKKRNVLYGIYQYKNPFSEYNSKKIKCFFDKNRINIVYSGVIDLTKGAFRAVEIAKYLDANYHIHIIGFGDSENIEKLKLKILEISKITECKVTYDGLFKGNNYDLFLYNCDIGLCTQDKEATFSETSFPSKIMSYICCGLNVISVKLNSIVKSELESQIILYENEDSNEIANIILNLKNVKKKSNIEFIKKLDANFKKSLIYLMK